MIRNVGDRVVLVGVAHVFPESMDEVTRVISEEKPQIVAVELCRSRYIELMKEPEERRSIQTGFSTSALFAKVLNFFQERIGQETGMMPGEEMLAAIQKADEIGAEVSLIDRNISLTLQRLMDKMSFWEKCKLAAELLFSFLYRGDGLKYEDLNEEEVIDRLIETLRDTSESVYKVLIEERNSYMAERISRLLDSRNGKVVCVVGAGHLRGLEEQLEIRLNEKFQGWDEIEYEWTI